MDDTEQVLEHEDVVLVEKEVIVFGAGVALVCVRVAHALGARSRKTLQQDQALLTRSHLGIVTPKGHIQLRVKLIRTESDIVRFQAHEGAIMAIVSHDEPLFLQEKLMSHYLQRLGVVLQAERLRFHYLGLDRVWSYDRLSDIDLGVLYLRDRLRKDGANLRSIEKVRVLVQTGQFGQKQVESGVFCRAKVHKLR